MIREKIKNIDKQMVDLKERKSILQRSLREEILGNCPHCNSEEFHERSELGSRVHYHWFECYDCGYKTDAKYDSDLEELVPCEYDEEDANKQMEKIRLEKEQKYEKLKKELEKQN